MEEVESFLPRLAEAQISLLQGTPPPANTRITSHRPGFGKNTTAFGGKNTAALAGRTQQPWREKHNSFSVEKHNSLTYYSNLLFTGVYSDRRFCCL